LNTFKNMSTQAPAKSEDTRLRIYNAALDLFRTLGFDKTTMREIALRAEVATGAAYYYYDSKEAIVMAFYRRTFEEMQPRLQSALQESKGLERRLAALIRVKLEFFAEYREVLRALLRSGSDPKHPLSPFSPETREIREADIAWFWQIFDDGSVRIPRDLAPHLPEALWMFQMGIIYFWITDESENQARTARLLELGVRIVASLVRWASLPIARPLRKPVLELIEIVKGS
jgi:AcrR family transcriptional regulator